MKELTGKVQTTHAARRERWRRQIISLMRRLLHKPPVHYINGPETLPAPLSNEEEQAIFCRIMEGDESAREPLITHNLRLVVYIARKFESSGVGLEDLISIGTIGLIKAVNTFSPERSIKLATYASRCIENEILMYLRKTGSVKWEISLDEPLNIDWDGNELLLSDVLGSDPDSVSIGIEEENECDLLREAVNRHHRQAQGGTGAPVLMPSRAKIPPCTVFTVRRGIISCEYSLRDKRPFFCPNLYNI